MKKKKLKLHFKFLIFFSILLVSILLWARFIGTRGLIIKEYKLTSAHLAPHFHGLKIVHFSDLHYGRTIKKQELIHIVNNINLLKPDLVFFTGDLIDKDIIFSPDIEKTVIKQLQKIKATYGKYAISGNHDFYLNSYHELLLESDFINLNNNCDIIYNHYYEKLYIGGIESEIKGKPNIKEVITCFNEEEIDNNYKILLMHTPDTFNNIKKYHFDLVLAGHSHNGQVRLPFVGKLITPLGAKKYYEAYYKIDNTDFFISGGLGTSTINFRLFNPPSLNFYRLTKK